MINLQADKEAEADIVDGKVLGGLALDDGPPVVSPIKL